METVQMQAPDEKPTTTTTSPGIDIISLEFAGPNKNSGVSAGGGAEERRRLERVQEEENIEECTTLKGEPSKIMDPSVCLPPLAIKIPSREFADEKRKNPIVVDGGVKQEERTLERTTEEEEEKDECTTPKGEANRIPVPTVCPPPPARRFKRSSKQITEIPPDKYFPVPSDLNSVFIPLKKIRTS